MFLSVSIYLLHLHIYYYSVISYWLITSMGQRRGRVERQRVGEMGWEGKFLILKRRSKKMTKQEWIPTTFVYLPPFISFVLSQHSPLYSSVLFIHPPTGCPDRSLPLYRFVLPILRTTPLPLTGNTHRRQTREGRRESRGNSIVVRRLFNFKTGVPETTATRRGRVRGSVET